MAAWDLFDQRMDCLGIPEAGHALDLQSRAEVSCLCVVDVNRYDGAGVEFCDGHELVGSGDRDRLAGLGDPVSRAADGGGCGDVDDGPSLESLLTAILIDTITEMTGLAARARGAEDPRGSMPRSLNNSRAG
jgi:hypothetical protein